jgi:hypothetical protein
MGNVFVDQMQILHRDGEAEAGLLLICNLGWSACVWGSSTFHNDELASKPPDPLDQAKPILSHRACVETAAPTASGQRHFSTSTSGTALKERLAHPLPCVAEIITAIQA